MDSPQFKAMVVANLRAIADGIDEGTISASRIAWEDTGAVMLAAGAREREQLMTLRYIHVPATAPTENR